jgi:hypothetical protein
MGGFGPDGYTAREISELLEDYIQAVEHEYEGDLEPYEGSFNRALFKGFSRAVHENQEQDLERLYDSMFVESASGQELTDLARQYGVRRQPAVAATGVVEWSRSTTESELVVQKGVPVETDGADPIRFITTEASTFQAGEQTTRSNVKAVEAGTVGNLGADRLVIMPSPPPGVSGVTNPFPTGDPDFTLTDGETQLRLGQDKEGDESVRDRVLEGASIGGAATVRAVRDKIRSLDGTPSLSIFTNRQLTDNANGNGLPKLSAELVIRAPSVPDQNVAKAIHDVVSITDRLTSGHNGTTVTADAESDVLVQTRTLEWSQPTEVNLELTLDVVTEDGYVGDPVVEQTVAEYIGGTLPDGSPAAGLDVSSDVIIDELERRVSGIQGVLGVATVTVDADGDGTDDTTTRADGLRAFEIEAFEVAVVDGTADIEVT